MTWSFSGDNGGRAISGYDWQVSTVGNFSSLFASGNSYSGTSQTVSGLTPATQYFFRVRAENSVSDGPWSSIRSLVAPQGVKRWSEADTWVAVPMYHWDGTEWAVPTSIKGRSGAGWVEAT
jgi:phosphodiesterase/alkaline phosphatase D-like protein